MADFVKTTGQSGNVMVPEGRWSYTYEMCSFGGNGAAGDVDLSLSPIGGGGGGSSGQAGSGSCVPGSDLYYSVAANNANPTTLGSDSCSPGGDASGIFGASGAGSNGANGNNADSSNGGAGGTATLSFSGTGGAGGTSGSGSGEDGADYGAGGGGGFGVNGGGAGGASHLEWNWDAITIPFDPENVSIDSETDDRATLHWTYPGSIATGYDIEVAINGVGYTGTATHTAGPSATSKVLLGLVPGTTYVVRIATRNGGSLSNYVQEMGTFSTSSLLQPTDLSVDTITETTAVLHWTDASTANDGYEIECVLYSDGFGAIGPSYTPTANATNQSIAESYNGVALLPGTRYSIRIRATLAGSDPTNWVETDFTTNNSTPPPATGTTGNFLMF